jgi:two-component system LytT family response regulator
MTPAIRTLVADDEPLAREGLRVRLNREEDVEIVGEANDGPSTVSAILSLRPDVVFLDVQMPGMDGFEVVARTASEHLPVVVFVTAFDRYALRAFAAHALDYLLKPIAHRRFQDALQRVRRELDRNATRESVERLRSLLETRDADAAAVALPASRVSRYTTRFTSRDGDRLVLVRTADVDWVEAAANYVRLHVGARSFSVRMPMGEVERRLDPVQFVRVHRSAIVNVDRIAEIRPDWHGEYQVALTTGASLRLSRGYRDRLLK